MAGLRSARPLALAAALACLATPLLAAPEKLPVELRLIPPDAAVFVHLDFAALYDGKIGDAVKNSKSAAVLDKLAEFTQATGMKAADIKTLVFCLPNGKDPRDLQRGMVVVTFRKPFDRAAVIARLKETAEKAKDEFRESGGVVRVTSSNFDKRTVVTDVSDATRMVILNDLPETHLKAADAPTGLHADAVGQAAKVPFVAAVNFNALPDEIRGEGLPAEVRPFQPIFKADSLTFVGTVGKERIDLSVRVRSKEKTNAIEVEKALDAVRTFLSVAIPQAKKTAEKEAANPKEFAALLDAAAKALNDAKFGVQDKETTVALSVPTDLPFGTAVELFFGGGLSQRTVSQNNLKQLALGVYNYESAFGHYPAAVTLGKKGKKLLGWRVAVLPFIEQDALYKKFNHDEPWDSEHNLKVLKDNPMPQVFALPGSKSAGEKKTHYQVLVGNGAMFDTAAALKVTDIKDGTSNTIMIATAVEWTKPDDIEFDPKADLKKLLLFQGGVCQMAMGDGSVRAVSDKVSDKTLKAVATRDGSEVAGDDF